MPRNDLARRFPVLCRHWPGFPPDTPGDEPPPCVRDLRFRRNVEKLHHLGPRVLHEYLVEVGATRSIRTFLEDRIGDYAALDERVLAEFGGDKFAPLPLREVS